jgi:hypothetical protein
MDWEAVGAIGEIVGALGVVATLGYLAVQTRHNTRAIKGSTFQANTQLWQEWFLTLAGSEAPDAYARGMVGDSNLDGPSFQKFWLACRALFLNFESQYYQYRQGVLDEASFRGYEQSLRDSTLPWPGIRAWWQLNRGGYGRDYAAYIDQLIESTREAAAKRASTPDEMLVAWKAILKSDTPAG